MSAVLSCPLSVLSDSPACTGVEIRTIPVQRRSVQKVLSQHTSQMECTIVQPGEDVEVTSAAPSPPTACSETGVEGGELA